MPRWPAVLLEYGQLREKGLQVASAAIEQPFPHPETVPWLRFRDRAGSDEFTERGPFPRTRPVGSGQNYVRLLKKPPTPPTGESDPGFAGSDMVPAGAAIMMGEEQRDGKRATLRALGVSVPADHLLRRIDPLLDQGELRDALAPHYSRKGRPSIAPELLVRMMLIGRLYGIGSERRLCEEVRYNLAYRWFCRIPLGADVPHHSTFSKNRHGRFREAGVFRQLFERSVRRCVAAGLVVFKDAAIDASFIAADANA